MAVTITDELRLLIRAEADQAIKETKAYQTNINELHKSHKKLAADSKDVGRQITKTTGVTTTAADKSGKLRSQVDGLADSHQKLGSGAQAVKKQLVQTLGVYASAGAAVALMTKYVRDAERAFTTHQGEARKFQITYREVFGEAEAVAKEWADTFLYAESTAMKVIGSAGDIYTGMGMAADSALDLSERTAYLGGALSKLNPQLGSAADATDALITATLGEREALKRWGVVVDEASVQAKILERGQQNLTGAAMRAAKAQATLDIAYEQSPNALNAVTSATQLVADTNRYLSETWKEHLELSGKVVAQALQPVKNALADWLKVRNDLTKAQREADEIGLDTDAIQAYENTADEVERLADTYDELQAKSELNTEEQKNLKKVIKDLNDIVPSAATGWNEYGEAIDVSSQAARDFAEQQRELKAQELELQMLRLESQKAQLEIERADDIAAQKKKRDRLAEKQARLTELESLKKIADTTQELLTTPGEGLSGAKNYLREQAEELKGTILDPEKIEDWGNWKTLGLKISGIGSTYRSVAGDVKKLDAENKELIASLKEYDVLSAQIEGARAEIEFLNGSEERLLGILEKQAARFPEISEDLETLQQNYGRGRISAGRYREELEKLIASAKVTGGGGAPPSGIKGEWDKFLDELTGGMSLDEAIAVDVKLSPIEPDGVKDQLEAQLGYYEDMIKQLWEGREQFDSFYEWKNALADLTDAYNETKDEITDITAEEKALDEAEQEREDRASRAQELKLGLLSEEERAKQQLAAYELELLTLQREGLITEAERRDLIKEQKEAIEELAGNSDPENTGEYLEQQAERIKEEFFSIEALSREAASAFADIGAAMAAGDDAMGAAGKALQEFTSQLLKELSMIAVSAALRVIAEGGLAAIPAAIFFLGLAGITGIASGMFGGSGKGVDGQIKDELADELGIRKNLNEALNEQLDLEYDLLRRQLDRNLISEEEFLEQAGEITAERNQGEAASGALSLISDEINTIDKELSDMSGWKKFWSGDDEDLEDDAEELSKIAEQINDTTDPEELKTLIAKLKDYGLNAEELPAFASGGSFITNGPQPIMVGDNPSGKELVQITPIENMKNSGRQNGEITVNINGPVFDIDDFFSKLQQAGIKARRRGTA